MLGVKDTSNLVGHFCRFPKKGRKEIEEMKREARNKEEQELK